MTAVISKQVMFGIDSLDMWLMVSMSQGYGRLGGLGEVDARALWMRQNMPAESFHQVCKP